MHILLVDADKVFRNKVRAGLEGGGHTVVWSATGQGALRLLRSEAPGLMVLDMGLPDISGWEVRRLQLLDEAIAFVPVIVLSSLLPEEIRRLDAVHPMALVQLIMTKTTPPDVHNILRAIEHIGGLREVVNPHEPT